MLEVNVTSSVTVTLQIWTLWRYLSEQLNYNLYYTLEKLIFQFINIFFCLPFFVSQKKNWSNAATRDESSKSSQRDIASVWIIIIFPSYELYKIVRISVICFSTRVCSKSAMIEQSRWFRFFKANFELTCVHLCYIFWSRT